MYSLAKLPTMEPSANVLDSLCSCFLLKVELANAEDIIRLCVQLARPQASALRHHQATHGLGYGAQNAAALQCGRPAAKLAGHHQLLGWLRSAEVTCLREGREQAGCSPAEHEGADMRCTVLVGNHSLAVMGHQSDAHVQRFSEGYSCSVYTWKHEEARGSPAL